MLLAGYELINPGSNRAPELWSPPRSSGRRVARQVVIDVSPSMYKPEDPTRGSSPLRVACKGGGLPSGELVRGKYRSDTGISRQPRGPKLASDRSDTDKG